MSFSLETPNVLSNPKYFKFVAIIVALRISLPTPIATILIPIDLDALISIPLSVPLKGPGIAITTGLRLVAMKYNWNHIGICEA